MADRKAITPKVRLEVFKRDGFKCQYCGRSAPEVLLEVDHIVPVAEGGDNDFMNLVTSCRDCNRGKGKTQLNDDAVVKRQQKELEYLHERREQMEMMIQWRDELSQIRDMEIDALQKLCEDRVGITINKNDRIHLYDLLMRFSFQEVYEATEISLKKYCPRWGPSNSKFSFAMDKIGGICYNRRRNAQEEEK